MGIVLALGTVVATNITMVVIAINNPSIPETKEHWKESLHFDQELALREQSALRGWTMQLGACETLSEDGHCTLWVRVLDRNAKPVTGLQGKMRLRRDDQEESDRSTELLAHKDGYQVRFLMGQRGSYRVELRTTGPQTQWRATQRVMLEPLPFSGRHS